MNTRNSFVYKSKHCYAAGLSCYPTLYMVVLLAPDLQHFTAIGSHRPAPHKLKRLGITAFHHNAMQLKLCNPFSRLRVMSRPASRCGTRNRQAWHQGAAALLCCWPLALMISQRARANQPMRLGAGTACGLAA